MNGTTNLKENTSELRVEKMQFTVINRRPQYTKDMQEKTKADIEEQLYDIFKRYV